MPRMKWMASVAGLVLTGAACAARGGTFSDSLMNGLNPSYWSTYDSVASTYVVNPTSAGVELSKSVSTSGNQLVNAYLNMAAVGGNISGDFSAQISFSNAVIGPNEDQVQFDSSFTNDDLFFDVYDLDDPGNSGSHSLNGHVYTASTGNPNGTVNTPMATSATGGTFSISRTGSTLTGYFDGSPMFSQTETGALEYIDFRLETQGNPNPNSDTASVEFTNFSLTASSVPEPASLGLLVAAGAMAMRRRRRGARPLQA